jgi:protein kinase-like protein/FHA domain-containing protein
MAFLIYENHSGAKAVPLDNDMPDFNIGRSMDNHLRLREDSMISRHHCTIYQHQATGQYVLKDLGSSNGTYINEHCLLGNEAVIVDMDQLTVGNMIFVFLTAENVQYAITETATIMVNSPAPDISSPDDALMTETARLDAIIPPPSELGRISGKFELAPEYPTVDGFEIMNTLGYGGSNNATTYLAYQTALKRSVAVKIFNTLPLSATQKDEFIGHVQVAGKLQHPNIISYIDAGITENNCFLSMQYAEAGNLTQKLSAGTLEEKQATGYISKLVNAMIHSSNAKIVHYNITPNNILFSNSGELALSDFGLAEWEARAFQINRNYFFGSTKYMAPEQMLDTALDWTCDQYALGAVFYEMLVGQPAFDAPSIYALIEKHMREKIRFPTNLKLTEKTRNIICKMMEKTPAKRFKSWQAVAQALKEPASPSSSSAKSRKNIPLQRKGMANIVKKTAGIQIAVKKRKMMLKK